MVLVYYIQIYIMCYQNEVYIFNAIILTSDSYSHYTADGNAIVLPNSGISRRNSCTYYNYNILFPLLDIFQFNNIPLKKAVHIIFVLLNFIIM